MQQMETLEHRTHFAASDPWRSVKTEIDAAAGGMFKTTDTVATETGRTYLLGLVNKEVAIAALGSNGHIDKTFGGGVVRIPSGKTYDDGVLLDSYRHSVLTTDRAGNVFVATGTEVTKFQLNGRRDLSFGRRGVQAFASADLGLNVQDALATTDGRVLVVTRILRNHREKYSLFEITPTFTKPFFGTSRATEYPTDNFENRGKQDAYLLEGAGVYCFVWRSNDLQEQPDNGGPYAPVTRTSNDLKVTRFSTRLKFHDGRSIALQLSTDITDVRIARRGTMVEATGNTETLRFDFENDRISRSRRAGEAQKRPIQTRFASDGTLWQAYARSGDGTDDLYIEQIHRDGSLVDGSAVVHLADTSEEDGLFNTLRVRADNSLILTTGVPSYGISTTRHVRPGVDRPSVSGFTNFTYQGNPYITVSYAAPYGIAKATVDYDLEITSPSGEELASGISGAYRLGGGNFKARYWINAPGGKKGAGAWTNAEPGVYTIRLKDAAITDGLGIFNVESLIGTFTIE